jgi:hypothetical protein
MRIDEKRRAIGKNIMSDLNVFLAHISNVRKNPLRALRAPETTVARLMQRIESLVKARIESHGPSAFFDPILDALPHNVDLHAIGRENLAEYRQTLSVEPAGGELLALFEEAATNGPVSPLLMLIAPPNALSANMADDLRILRGFTEASRSEGESRATALRDTVLPLMEKVYTRYLHAVWAMTFLARASGRRARLPRWARSFIGSEAACRLAPPCSTATRGTFATRSHTTRHVTIQSSERFTSLIAIQGTRLGTGIGRHRSQPSKSSSERSGA